MKILYLCADTGICVDRDMGGGSHVRETVHSLRRLGHEVVLLAADCASSDAVEGLDHFRDERVKRHKVFDGLTGGRSGTADTEKANPAEAKARAETPSSLDPPKKPDASPPREGSKAWGKSGDRPNTEKASGRRLLSRLREKAGHFAYGPFRNRVNLWEERTAYPIRFRESFREKIKNFKPDAVYERYALGFQSHVTICRQFGIPHLLEVNALLAQEAAKQGLLPPLRRKRLVKREYDFLRRETEKVLVVSRQLKERIGENLAHVAVNPNGVDVETFSPDVSGESVRRRHGLENQPVVGWVGSFGRGRGVEDFLEIAARIHERRPDVRFLLVGDGALREKIGLTIENHGMSEAFALAGRVPKTDIPPCIAAMDIATAPYPAFGAEYFSPLKVFEYMAMGRPVAATAIGQCAELLKDGVGLLLPPSRPERWAEEIHRLLDDPERQREMGKKARERVMRRYTWTRNAERIIEHVESSRNHGRGGDGRA